MFEFLYIPLLLLFFGGLAVFRVCCRDWFLGRGVKWAWAAGNIEAATSYLQEVVQAESVRVIYT